MKSKALRPSYQRVKKLQSMSEGFTISHIPSEQNKEADKLANRAFK